MRTATMTAQLTSRERVNRLFERRDHDRVPRDDSYWKETIARWNAEGFPGDFEGARQFIDADIEPICGALTKLYPGTDTLVREDEETKVVRDAWGGLMRYWKNRSGTPQHLGWECDSRQAWETRIKPQMLSRSPEENLFGGRLLREIPDVHARGRKAGRWMCVGALETFELLRRIVGDETMLIAMAEDPDWIRDMSMTFTDIILRDHDAILATGVDADGFWIYGDMAFNHGPFCSPRMYRELVWPDHKRICDWAHARGMKVIYHSDGDINSVLDLFIAAGIDMIQPMEAKANMDVRTFAPKLGDRLAFFGNIDMAIAGTNDRDRIEHEVRTKLAAGMAAKAYAYHSDHSVPPTVSWETYQFIINLLDRYGRY